MHACQRPLPCTVLALLLCLALCALPGCASKGGAQGPMPNLTRLAPRHLGEGSCVFVEVRGLNNGANEDLASLVTASLQSERGLVPADSRSEADAVVAIDVKDIYLCDTSGARLSGSQTLGNTLMGTVLGLGVGGIAGGRTGALVGAGAGALLGLGATAFDAKSDNTWAMVADVSIVRRGEQPAPEEHAVTAKGHGMTREESLAALKEQLAQDIVGCVRK